MKIEKSEIGTVNIEATVFKHGISQTEFIKDKAVIFTLNGQVHGSRPRGFISKSLGLSMLRDSLLVNIDCTKMRTSFRQDLFMANRYNMKEGNKYEMLIDIIIDRLKHNNTLKELNQNRKNQVIRDTTEDKELLKSLAKSLPLDNDLLRLLKKSGDLDIFGRANGRKADAKEKDTSKQPQKPNVSRRFPSIFKIDLKDKANGKVVKSIPLNGKGIIKFETDVEDEYLFRPKEPGELQLQVLGIQSNETSTQIRKKLYNEI
ncbi:MAG: hypothetical protein ACE5GV_17000 [Candidatus Scalindua sp.]